MNNKQAFNLALLLIATSIWGMGFAATRWTLVDYSPVWSNSMRYVFAALLSLPYLFFNRTIKDIKGPLICASLLLLALQLQTIGIAHTTLAKSGFITVFYAIFTPVLTFVFWGHRFRKTYWLLLTIAMTGILFLCNLDFTSFNFGDLVTLISALVFALHIMAIDKFAQTHHAVEFNLLQCFYMGILSIPIGIFFGGVPRIAPLLNIENLFRPSALLGFIVLSFFSSIVAFSFQVYAQKTIPPHIVSLTFLMESMFAALFGYLLFNEILTPLALVGCFLVLLSVALIPKFATLKKCSSTT